MTDETLLPCPFCGDMGKPREYRGRGVKCGRCKAWGPDPERPGVDWNTRAALRPAPAGEGGGMVERLHRAPNMTLNHGALLKLVADAADALTAIQERAEAAEKRAEEAEAEAARLREAAKTLRRARFALATTDNDDWDRLLRFIPTSGYGDFWRSNLLTLRAALGGRHD